MSSALQTLVSESFTADATICSILPREDGQDHTVILRTHGAYFIYHPHEGEAYKLSHVSWKRDFADVGEYDPAYTRRSGIERRKEFTFDAKSIADDICKQINSNGPGDASFFGVFVCTGSTPTEQELETAHKRLNSYFMQCVAAADSEWSSSQRHDLISGIAKRGARYLKLNPEDHGWMSNFQQMDDCPACGTRIKPNVAICRGCGAILNKEKAAEFGLLEREVEVKKSKAERLSQS